MNYKIGINYKVDNGRTKWKKYMPGESTLNMRSKIMADNRCNKLGLNITSAELVTLIRTTDPTGTINLLTALPYLGFGAGSSLYYNKSCLFIRYVDYS